MIQLTRVGLGITAIFSICLALYFEYAVDIWYLVGSFVVPALLIPLLAALYRIKLKSVVFVMILPVIASAFWYVHGVLHPLADGYPGYIWGLDPMYPGLGASMLLICWFRK
jgi:SSS family solute:Na+ symporter